MLATLSRIFQASTESNAIHDGHDDDFENGHGRIGFPGSPGRSKQRVDTLGLGIDTSRLERKPSSTLSSAGVDRPRPPGPSHVSWKSPSSQTSPASLHQTASSPSLLFSPRGFPEGYRPSSLRRQSSQSSHIPSPEPPGVDGEGLNSRRGSLDPSEFPPAKQLSPIDESVSFPPRRRPSVDSLPPTPDSTRVFDGHNVQAQGFLSRTLKRSISQTSTSTLRSTVSAAPSIPPLDLRPTFQSATGAPRKSRLPPPSLPTVLGSPPRPAKVSVIYEDGASARTGSFITAPSEHTPDVADADITSETAVDTTGPAPRDEDITLSMFEREYAPSSGAADSDGTGRGDLLPAGLYGRGRAPASTHTLSSAGRSLPRTRRSADSDSDTEAYIHQRWLKGVSFGSDRFVVPPAPRAPRTTSACVLFWLGFAGPWCWLIGGWLLSRGGEMKPEGEDGALPVFMQKTGRPRGLGAGVQADLEKAGESREALHPAATEQKKHGMKLWFPLVARSLSSRTSLDSMHKQAVQVDPWVLRCRVAAIVSGVLILAAFIVAVVVVGVRS